MPVADRIATPEGKRRYVRTLFATIASRYDFITVALSYGQDRRWKRRLIDLAAPRSGTRALDVATGTGDIAFALAARGADAVGLDVTRRMIEIAHAKAARGRQPRDRRPEQAAPQTVGAPAPRAKAAARSAPRFVVGDMMALPFPSQSFDLVTTGYGLRNVPDLTMAIDEIGRVLRPGGQLLSLDFNRPSNGIVRAMYLAYLTIVGATLGWILHRDPDTYRYIPASIRQYPGAVAVARLLETRGFATATYYPVLGGLMAIHHARRC